MNYLKVNNISSSEKLKIIVDNVSSSGKRKTIMYPQLESVSGLGAAI